MDSPRLKKICKGFPLSPHVLALTPQPSTLLSWADDVEEFINKLGLAEKGTERRCWVLGYSLGSPFAVACAYKLADYLHGVLLAGSISPHDTPHAMEGMRSTVITKRETEKYFY